MNRNNVRPVKRGIKLVRRRCKILVWRLSALIWLSFALTADGQAGLVLSGPEIAQDRHDFGAVRQLLAEGNYQQARTRLETITLGSTDVPHREIILARLLLELGKPAAGRQVMEALAAAQPDRFDVRMMFCEMAVSERRWLEGLLHAKGAAQLGIPKAYSERYRLEVLSRLAILTGRCCEGRSDWEGAIAAYHKAEGSSSPEWLVGLARANFFAGRPGQSLKYFKLLAQARPDADLPYVALAKLYASQGKAEECEKSFRAALTGEDQRVELARIQFAQWLITNNRPEEVPPVLQQECSRPIIEQQRRYLAALVARLQGRVPDAIELLAALHQEAPESFTYGNQLALTLIESSDESARARALQIASLHARNLPSNPDALATLGWVQLQLGDLTRAEQVLMASCARGVADRNTAHFLATLLERKGETETAAVIRSNSESLPGPYFYAARP